MRRTPVAISFASLLALLGCGPDSFEGPVRLLESPAAAGNGPRVGTVATGGDARPALLESASYRVTLPRRGLLTFGLGVSYAGAGEAPGWYRFALRIGGRLLAERSINPRAARGWREVSLPLKGQGGQATLEFDIRLTDRNWNTIDAPKDLLLAVADPTLHDLDDYGRSRGIVLVSIDTLRRDHVGAYGYPKPSTPRLDALGRQGLLCEDAVSTSSWTLPAHLSMLTSVPPGLHGGVDMGHGFNRTVPTLAATLRQRGFSTQAVTSHLYVSAVYGVDEGFDHLDFRQDRKATEVANRAIDLLDRFGDRPFFLFLHFYDPHWHYDPPEHTRRLFEAGYSGTLTGLWQDFSRRQSLSPADLEHLLALYDGEIRYVDDELGRVLDHLRERGLERGTLLVVTSDHGEEFLDHGSWEHQKTLYEEVIRVPLVVRGPGISSRREASPTSLLDVVPTVLDWAGVAPAGRLHGRSLLLAPGERECYGETEHTADGTRKLFLRSGQRGWKAILSLAPDSDRLANLEWYDLAMDPLERRRAPAEPDLAVSVRDRAMEMWRQGRAGAASAPPVDLTAEQRERLRALGYVIP